MFTSHTGQNTWSLPGPMDRWAQIYKIYQEIFFKEKNSHLSSLFNQTGKNVWVKCLSFHLATANKGRLHRHTKSWEEKQPGWCSAEKNQTLRRWSSVSIVISQWLKSPILPLIYVKSWRQFMSVAPRREGDLTRCLSLELLDKQRRRMASRAWGQQNSIGLSSLQHTPELLFLAVSSPSRSLHSWKTKASSFSRELKHNHDLHDHLHTDTGHSSRAACSKPHTQCHQEEAKSRFSPPHQCPNRPSMRESSQDTFSCTMLITPISPKFHHEFSVIIYIT